MKRRLSSDEKALWNKVTRDVRALAPDTEGAADAPAPEPAPGPPAPAKRVRRAAQAAPAPPPPPRAKLKPLPPSPFKSGDPALDRKARRGRMPPERTLDLHGLTQRSARARLISFLKSASADGLRCVLVITGKGPPDGAAHDPNTEQSPRGVLRLRFIEWIGEDGLRALVTRVAQAAQGDGGRGAFYVFLKRR